MGFKKKLFNNLSGDFFGGTAAMLVGLPSTIAYGLISFAPLGKEFASVAAVGSILGTITFGILASILRGTKSLISVPSAAAAAVLSVFVAELVHKGSIPLDVIPVYVMLLTVLSGVVQFVIGNFGGGKFIKYIPYPVITGYLYGVAVLLLIGQIPKLFGLPKGIPTFEGIFMVEKWRWESVCIGGVTIVSMILAHKYLRKFPTVVVALVCGIATYFILAIFNHDLLDLKKTTLVIGAVSASPKDLLNVVVTRWSLIGKINFEYIYLLIVPGITLSLLLSITSLNTCVVLDSLTYSNHDPRKELMIQGVGNVVAAFSGGIPGAGIITATLENVNSGGKTHKSILLFALMTLFVLIFVGGYLAWIPIPALAGMLIVIAVRMIDFKVVSMLKNKSTILDFVVIVAVVVAAASLDLIKAAGVGIAMAIFLFLREQMGVSIIRRKIMGSQVFSKKIRIANERKVLEIKGEQTVIIELQGQLFFGTTDQLFSKLEPFYSSAHYFVLDMRRIQSVDYTAANMLKKIFARVKEKNSYLIFTSVPVQLPTGQNLRMYLEDLGLNEKKNLKYFDDLDGALVWIEDDILITEKVSVYADDKVLDLHELELFEGFPTEALENLYECMEVKTFKPNELIFKGGDKSDEIYFVRKGNIKIVLSLAGGKFFHLLTIGMGGVFGEMAFIDNVTRSADAVSVDNTNLYVISRDKFNQVSKVHPEISGLLFERLALLIANRLRQSNKELKVFQEN